MAFIASQVTLRQGLENAMMRALSLKQIAQMTVNQLASTTDANYIFARIDEFRLGLSQLQSYAAISGMSAYAQQQLNTPTYDVVTEFNNMIAALQAVIAWVVNNFPKEVDGFLKDTTTINSDGSRTAATFTSAQTSGWVTALNSFIATIA